MKLHDIYSRFSSPNFLVQIRNIPVCPTIYVFFISVFYVVFLQRFFTS